MNANYELSCAVMDQEQVEQFSYNLTAELITNYVLEHQEEYEAWKDVEYMKKLVKRCFVDPMPSIKDRIELLQILREEQLK